MSDKCASKLSEPRDLGLELWERSPVISLNQSEIVSCAADHRGAANGHESRTFSLLLPGDWPMMMALTNDCFRIAPATVGQTCALGGGAWHQGIPVCWCCQHWALSTFLYSSQVHRLTVGLHFSTVLVVKGGRVTCSGQWSLSVSRDSCSISPAPCSLLLFSTSARGGCQCNKVPKCKGKQPLRIESPFGKQTHDSTELGVNEKSFYVNPHGLR